MKNLLFILLGFTCWILVSCAQPKSGDETSAAAASPDTTMAPAEITDPKYVEIGKKALANLSSGNMDGWTSIYADNARYYWNSGDSLIGKAAISEFWTKRRLEMIDSLDFSQAVYLPVKVNKPQSNEAPGTWLLSWYRVYAKYKNGKSMSQWMHILFHFDAQDKVDQVIHYRDNAPILAATGK